MNKRALLIGLNYPGTSSELRGCVNDVLNVKSYLKEGPLQFLDEEIIVYTDIDPNTKKYTTATGIMNALYEMVVLSWKEDLDALWIHYSGHGASVRDAGAADERDGLDECLVPSDYTKAGLISDDTLCTVLQRINPKTRVFCLMDCCHSGSIADLPFMYRTGGEPIVENANVIEPRILAMSGCSDHQTSADAFNVGGDRTFTGALTSCVLQALQENPAYLKDAIALLDRTRTLLRDKRFSQFPQLTSSFKLPGQTGLFELA